MSVWLMSLCLIYPIQREEGGLGLHVATSYSFCERELKCMMRVTHTRIRRQTQTQTVAHKVYFIPIPIL